MAVRTRERDPLRLTAGLKHKAAKAELRQGLPVGLDHTDDQVVITTDEGGDPVNRDGVPAVREAGFCPSGATQSARGRAVAVSAPQREMT